MITFNIIHIARNLYIKTDLRNFYTCMTPGFTCYGDLDCREHVPKISF